MIRRITVLAFAAGLLLSASGCGIVYHIVHYPFGPGTMCDPEHCSPERDPYLPLSGCGVTSNDCGPACGPGGASCTEVTCGSCWGPCYDRGPLGWLFGVLGIGFQAERGCGEIYWGDFHGFPPDCCDPCDQCGNYIGSSCGSGGCYGEGAQVVGPTPGPSAPSGCAVCRSGTPTPAAASDPGYAQPVMRVEPIELSGRPQPAETRQ